MGRKKINNSKRDEEVLRIYREGATQKELAQKFKLSRARIGQIINSQGATRLDGGVKSRKLKKIEARELYWLVKRGLTDQEYKELLQFAVEERKQGRACPLQAFQVQKHNARIRSIPWTLTLGQWWSIWLASGKWFLRGKTKTSYVMSRKGDLGGYDADNVVIQSSSDNHREYLRKRRGLL